MPEQISRLAPNCGSPFDFTNGRSLCHGCDRLSMDGLRRCSRVVWSSPAMRPVMERAELISRTDATVVVLGESGTGKEVVARALHVNSARSGQPFVAVNVAALAPDLLESELFGHSKGAFTGAAAARRGLFEEADGGTLFLDEIAEMPLPLQAKLLRVLQDGEVRRVGESRTFKVDVRVVCATHQDLSRQVDARLFRQDLYYRIKVFTIRVPPLRERVADILPLATVFLGQEGHPTELFTTGARAALERYRWPGNVRELANAVKHGAVLSRGADVDSRHLPEELLAPAAEPDAGTLRPLADVEREYILRVLRLCGGHHVETARVLGIGRTTLWRKLRQLEIDG